MVVGNCADLDWDFSAFGWFCFNCSRQEKISLTIGESVMKKLTQAVFDGLPPEFRWAAVDANGFAFVFDRHPPFIRDGM